jgi:tRNA(adenine34) deaminase
MKTTNRRPRTKTTKSKRWAAQVKTDSTHPQARLFTRSAATIAKALASKRVSPKGPGSGMRMLNYYINRAGRNLSVAQRRRLGKAKKLLSKLVAASKKSKSRRTAKS